VTPRTRVEDRPRSERVRVIVVASLASTVVVSPPFLVGVLAVQIGKDLGLTPGSIGMVTALFFGVTAASATALGRAVDARGPHFSLNLVLLVNILALAVIVTAPTVAWLAAGMAIGGIANGAIHPTANALLSQGVSGRLGLALGLKMAAMPASTLAAGLAIPLVALTVGWRVVPALAAALGALLLILVRRSGLPVGVYDARSIRHSDRRPLVGGLFTSLVIGAALGATASSTLGAFVVDSGVRMSGVEEAAAGVIVALSGAIGMGSRIGFGWFVDGRSSTLPYNASIGMLILGSGGFVLLSFGRPVAFLAGSVIAFGAGWGWQGLLNFAVLTGASAGAARATGRLLTGFASGSAFGPLVLGQVAEGFGYPVMWRAAAVLALIGATVIAFTRRGLMADLPS
jgi:predicted MFS family arabinose efflux permease